MTKKIITVGMTGILAWATVASAAMIEDFEGGYAGAGTVQADPLDAGNQVLNLAAGEVASFIPLGTAGSVTMKVYDFGMIPSGNGARWGVSTSTTTNLSSAATIIQKNGWLESSQGYGMGLEVSQAGDWWSPSFFGGPRQAAEWTTWTFDVANDGAVTISAFGTTKPNGTVTDLDSIWVSGGKAGQSAGLLVDDIEMVIPEPATLSLIGIAAGAMFFIRRRSRN